ncbi:MAG TPA: hypothetical protein VGY97_05100 [Solirubrobacteraceae bacterium]|jgi:hypothetical protein|nr:hypothetical protein [Solirubrobacteraceae bacterium]
MKAPPLLASRSPVIQVVFAVVVPAAYGLLCGVILGVSSGAYVVLTVLAALGGVAAGYDHADVLEGAGRGLAGGLLFGTFILFGHAVAGTHAKASLPHPHVVLPIVTTVGGVLLGILGAAVRGRRERRETAPPAEA